MVAFEAELDRALVLDARAQGVLVGRVGVEHGGHPHPAADRVQRLKGRHRSTGSLSVGTVSLVGRINESVDGDFGIFRDETIEADDRAFLMKIEDTVRAAVDEARFNALVQKLRDAKEAPILPAAAPKVVELAAKEFNIRQNESEGILGHLIAGGDLSLYGLANAVTRHAQDVQSYDRSTELEATGYKIITMQPSLLKRWNEEVSIV